MAAGAMDMERQAAGHQFCQQLMLHCAREIRGITAAAAPSAVAAVAAAVEASTEAAVAAVVAASAAAVCSRSGEINWRNLFVPCT